MPNNNSFSLTPKKVWTIFSAVFGFWLLSPILLPICFNDWAKQGQFGDMFGAVNALFSGFAFVGVIIAIILQKEELKLQREELEQTRKEFRRQTTEFEEQNKNLAVQRFENTFFNMLELLKPFAKDMSEKEYNGNIKISNLLLLEFRHPIYFMH